MDTKNLKKVLAGLGVASLISTGGITLPNAHGASG
jgi:radical SAM modification target selenobiotic family peptide